MKNLIVSLAEWLYLHGNLIMMANLHVIQLIKAADFLKWKLNGIFLKEISNVLFINGNAKRKIKQFIARKVSLIIFFNKRIANGPEFGVF